MCSGAKAGWYVRLIDFACHSTLGVRVIKKRRRDSGECSQDHRERADAHA